MMNSKPCVLSTTESPRPPNTSTEYERLSLTEALNLSDGHARQPLTPSQQRIIDRLPQLFTESEHVIQSDLESLFVQQFFGLAKQTILPPKRYLLSYSASTAIGLVSLLCQVRSLRVGLIRPAFDNIPNLLRAHQVPLMAIPEDFLVGRRLTMADKALSADVIWIVCPNNPTGFELSRDDFSALITFCKVEHKILVVDFCFRFFSSQLSDWDQYGVLESSGISYITIEDTGKTWPTLDMKVGITTCSQDLLQALYRYHDDLLLNVSPFHLVLLAELIRDTSKKGLEETIIRNVRNNRKCIRQVLEGSTLVPTILSEATTMEWLRIEGKYSGEMLWRELQRVGIHIMPGSNFFWDQPELGAKFVRIPLTRAAEMVATAAPIIRQVSDELARQGEHSLRSGLRAREER